MSHKLPTQVQSQTLIVTLPHDFSGLAVDHYREQFDELVLLNHSLFVLDFSQTEFIDSSGIGAMVFLYKRLHKQGKSLELLQVNGQPNKLMKLLRVDRTIGFIEQLQSA
ncbi:STAS domain-containing protein [Pseudoalteromonas tunicata]|uniref:STAS domain-containing protein n=1 Tax=Pseudoalteromonas tunicata TaxID=314281 RepID=UPI00273D8A1D|nr:STAS domain-containing protein [Pseudoalteromonas tunicata]MDP4985542.1 STAS domain-containing protein [Pseudoalteromonas tunicata]MDP5212905.1 STAS domain-containing protein [Pseudoalteromonas tunicata]